VVSPTEPDGLSRLKGVSTMLVVQSRALSHGRFDAASASAVADLAALLSCERVSLGLWERQSVRVTTMSGVTDLRARQDAVGRVAQAMQEALEQRCAIVHPLPPDMADHVTLAHAGLAQSNGRLSICTLPIVSGEQATGALLFERQAGFDANTLQLAKDAALFIGPVLVLQRRAESSLQARLRASMGRGPAGQPRSPWPVAALAAAIALFVLGAWPMPYRVVATARGPGPWAASRSCARRPVLLSSRACPFASPCSRWSPRPRSRAAVTIPRRPRRPSWRSPSPTPPPGSPSTAPRWC
jgi:hypothetical protein